MLDPNRDIPVDSFIDGPYLDYMETYDGEIPNLGFLDAGLWIYLECDRDLAEFRNPVLEVKNPNLDLVLLYEVRNRQLYLHLPEGDQFPFRKREINHRFFQFNLKSQPSDLDYLLLYIDNVGDQLFVPVILGEETAFKDRDYLLQYSNGLYFGIVIFVFLLNLFMFFSLKEKANLYYLMYIFGLIVLQLSLEGYGFELIWPESTYMANHANPFFATFSVLFLLQFCREFLNLRETLPRVNQIFRYFLYLLLIVLFSSLLLISWAYKFSILSINMLAFALNVLIIPIGFFLWFRGYKPARFFVSAFIVLVIGVFFFILRNFGFVPSNELTDKAIQFGSAMEVILLSLAIVDKFKIFKDQALHRLQEINEMKSRANVELEIKVNERTAELKEQKDIVDNKNQEITESITYAKRIQSGLLPSDHLFSSLLPEAFYVYLPKDIVSGDFYWIDRLGSRTYFAAIDCTGHGVPGAMVSVMGFNHLNRCLHEHNLKKPGEILDKLTELTVMSFRKSELAIYDGMDIALCCIDSKTKRVEFAGANNPLYVVTGGELIEIKGDKQPVGFNEDVKAFTTHNPVVKEGDWLYLFSDGFADQFGGTKNKKYKYKEFKKFLTEHSVQSAESQKNALIAEFNAWKGENQQVDDVCILGIRI